MFQGSALISPNAYIEYGFPDKREEIEPQQCAQFVNVGEAAG